MNTLINAMRTTESHANLFGGVYRNRRVLITGHTGFKGSWLYHWLQLMGADVVGLGLDPPSSPNHYDLLGSPGADHRVDIRDGEAVETVVRSAQPEIVFHLAAQPLVRLSYREPRYTYDTNVMGTVNLYEACRNVPSLRAIVSITSDKVYQNRESQTGYTEDDRLGGVDPYSNSKACVELLTDCYRSSFFNASQSDTLIASVRAGNVIGGGDWAEDRIIADAARSASQQQPLVIRNPESVRPWQHVLEPLAGYLTVGQRLLEEKSEFATNWNFGPSDDSIVTVRELISRIRHYWPGVDPKFQSEVNAPKETKRLVLCSEKAKSQLGWTPVWQFTKTAEKVANWYRIFYEKGEITTDQDIGDYISDAQLLGVNWTR